MIVQSILAYFNWVNILLNYWQLRNNEAVDFNMGFIFVKCLTKSETFPNHTVCKVTFVHLMF